jgi:DNA polymerase-3 subunit delta'
MPFSSVTGHRPVVDLLRRAVARQTLPQSLVFAGPEGVGKRLTATALAQALNCERQKDGDGCGTCASCSRIERGVHADVLVIEPGDTGVIKVDQVRDAIDRAAYRPSNGR